MPLPGPFWQMIRTRSVWPRAGDQYLASFPRSGNTWLRTVLTNVLLPGANSDPDVFNARIPGVTFRNLPAIYRLPSPRLLKTHSPWHPALRRAVYLVRNGEDSLVSYYHYLTTRRGAELPFETFFERYLDGAYGPPWHDHVVGWLREGRAALGDALLVVHFDAMKAHTPDEVERVLGFLGVEATPEHVAVAIEAASIQNMRQIEARRRGGVDRADAYFYRGGRSHDADDVFPLALREQFRHVSADAIALERAVAPPAGT